MIRSSEAADGNQIHIKSRIMIQNSKKNPSSPSLLPPFLAADMRVMTSFRGFVVHQSSRQKVKTRRPTYAAEGLPVMMAVMIDDHKCRPSLERKVVIQPECNEFAVSLIFSAEVRASIFAQGWQRRRRLSSSRKFNCTRESITWNRKLCSRCRLSEEQWQEN